MTGLELPTTAAALGASLQAKILGDPERRITRLTSLEHARGEALSFLSHAKYAEQLVRAKGAVVVTRPGMVEASDDITYLLVEDPQSVFAALAKQLRTRYSWHGISPLASIAEGCEIDPTAHIAAYAVIAENVRIGARTRIHPFVVLGQDTQIGDDCELHPHVVTRDGVQIGNRVRIHAGAVLGEYGFGFFRKDDQGPYEEMPHIGTVVIEDDVRIGANATVDRATLATTRVGRGTKLDNMAHVGHNAQVGQDCILCAQVAVGGSAVLEDDVVMGGQAAVGQGVHVGSGARMGGQCGATTNVPGKETYFFTPPIATRDFAKIYRALYKLPGLVTRVRALEDKGKSDG